MFRNAIFCMQAGGLRKHLHHVSVAYRVILHACTTALGCCFDAAFNKGYTAASATSAHALLYVVSQA